MVVVENLNIEGMVKGGLGRHIAGAGWGTFCTMLRYKLAARGGQLIEVPAHYSSQTCPACELWMPQAERPRTLPLRGLWAHRPRGFECCHCTPQPPKRR